MPEQVDGFTQIHVSGTGGGPKYGNILVQPYCSGPVIQHRKSEEIQLGYYSTVYSESGIGVEVTTARRASLYRFTFPKDSVQNVSVDAGFFLGENPVPHAREAQQFEDSETHVLSDFEIAGSQTISGGWNNGAPYTVYFYVATSRPFHATVWQSSQTEGGTKTGARLSFPEGRGVNPDVVNLKVGISFINEEQARVNAKEDIPNWDFETVRARCVSEWESLLCRVKVAEETPLALKRMLYTGLYHTMLMPTDRRERAEDPVYYDDYYAIWDTYRTSTPLLSLLVPERQTEIVNSLLAIYQKDGYMPDARSGNSNGRTQGGSNAELVIADAMARGLEGIDYNLALEAMLKDATVAPDDDEAEGRGGLAEYNQYGYIPYIIENGDGTYRRIARAGNRTVEYALCDWAIAEVAQRLGKKDVQLQYREQSKRWRNLWRADVEQDGARGFILPKNEKGEWLDSLPYGHSTLQALKFHYSPEISYEGPWYCKWWDCFMYEASSWEYSLSIPHDIPGLIELCGGDEAFERRLDTFFDHGYYNVANEPSFLTPCLYDWVGKPEKSEARIRKIIEDNFSDKADGLPGNDDGGAMSSWLVCHLLGMYPLAGTDQWLKHKPLIPGAEITRSDGSKIVVKGGVPITPKLKKKHASVQDTARWQFTYSLHGQTRRFRVWPEERDDSIVLNWSIVRNLKTWHGAYTITPEARERASGMSYEQPVDGLYITLGDDATFAMLSREAYRQLKRTNSCRFAGTKWILYDDDEAEAEGLLHAQDAIEGAEIWIKDDEDLPLIWRMENNPVEINWKVTEIE